MDDIVGRGPELAEIGSFLAVAAGAPRALLIRGDAGIGKTTLWRAALDAAISAGYRVLSSAAAGSEMQLSFTTLRDLLAAGFDDVAAELPEPQRHALAVALLQEEPAASPPDPATSVVAFLTALRALARVTPVLVAVDDVQWVDRASADCLAYALRRVDDDPIVFVLTQRFGAPDTVLERDLRTVTIDLEGLSVGALAGLLQERVGVAYPRPTLHRLHEVSGGNPFFALELARSVEQTPTALASGAPLPRSLRQLLRARVEALPQETLDALTYLAVLARPHDDIVDAAVLEPAVDANVIDRELRFTHPLLAAGVLDLASPQRLRDIHRRLADVVDDGEERVRHLALAADGPDADVAAALEDSARRIDARGHRIVSAELYEAAARLTPHRDRDSRARRALAGAAALFDAGDGQRAAADIEALLAEIGAGGSRVDAQLLLGRILADIGRWPEAMALWSEALAETDEPAATADIRSSMAVMSIYAGSAADALVHADEAVAAARTPASGDVRLAYAYAARAMAGVAGGDTSYRTFLQQALDLEPAGEPATSAWDWSPANAASACALHAFDLDEIRLRFGALLARGVETGNADLEQYGAYGLAHAELAGGNPARARELVDVVQQIAEETGVLRLPSGRLRAEIDAHVGRAAEARARLENVLAQSEARGTPRYAWQARSALGALELAEGQAEAAARTLRAARELADEIGMRDPALIVPFVDEVEAATEANLPKQADEALAAARGLTAVPSWGPPLLLRAAALVDARRGDLDAAEASLANGDDVLLPVQQGRTLLALGSVQRRLRRRGGARETLQRALATFSEAGAELWAERTRAEIARIGGRAPSPDRLTPSEQRIASLVGEGKTNKEVAAALVISTRTVESALSQIYRKLEVRSRTELARKLTDEA